jgi:hypothetical protein
MNNGRFSLFHCELRQQLQMTTPGIHCNPYWNQFVHTIPLSGSLVYFMGLFAYLAILKVYRRGWLTEEKIKNRLTTTDRARYIKSTGEGGISPREE